jgi:diacylglycerol kinase
MEQLYCLLDRNRRVKVAWALNSSSATVATYPEGEYVCSMTILMLPNPTIEQFNTYVENIIDHVLEAHGKAATANAS